MQRKPNHGLASLFDSAKQETIAHGLQSLSAQGIYPPAAKALCDNACLLLFTPPLTESIPTMSDDIQQKIDTLVKSHPIVLFMKGNASFPMCGFSGRAVQLLKSAGADPDMVYTVNVLDDEAVRQGIKSYSNWPTIPQLYVRGEFIGGSDIMQEMYEQGELQTLLASAAQAG